VTNNHMRPQKQMLEGENLHNGWIRFTANLLVYSKGLTLIMLWLWYQKHEREQDHLQAERGAAAAGGSAGLQAAAVKRGAC